MLKKISLFIALFTTVQSSANVYSAESCSVLVTADVCIDATLNTVEKGEIKAVWEQGNDTYTLRGDRVVWGYFYANPNDVSWGSKNNPDVFVKVWIDVSGRTDVNFFHVSVPNAKVMSSHQGSDVVLSSTISTDKRYAKHTYEITQTATSKHVTEKAQTLFTPQVQTTKPSANPKPQVISLQGVQIGSLIQTVEKGAIEGLWHLGGEGTTSRGDRVSWGFFYASPNDVSWGTKGNPEVFVKIWYNAPDKRTDVNFFHVSAPDIKTYSGLSSQQYEQESTLKEPVSSQARYSRHEYFNRTPTNTIVTTEVTTISSEEQKLYQLLNEHRNQYGLQAIPLSVSLTNVAQTHVRDLSNYPPSQYGQCNLHSWSDNGPWSSCCYTPDHAQAQCMWSKPKELTSYTGAGYEISAMATTMSAQTALNIWKASSGHNAVMINQSTWAGVTWNAVGVGINNNYAVIWFGEEKDPAGAVKVSDTVVADVPPTTSTRISKTKNIYIDSQTGLQWMAEELSFGTREQATTYCSNLNFGGYRDWRLSTSSELSDFVKALSKSPVKPSYFGSFNRCTAGITTDGYIALTTDYVSFGDPLNFTGGASVRCVRASP